MPEAPVKDPFKGKRWRGGRGPMRVNVTLNEIARLCGVHRRTLDRAVERGELDLDDFSTVFAWMLRKSNYGTRTPKGE
jgi:IS30 family transposase